MFVSARRNFGLPQNSKIGKLRLFIAADYGVIRGIYLSEGLIRTYKTAAERDADRKQRREP